MTGSPHQSGQNRVVGGSVRHRSTRGCPESNLYPYLHIPAPAIMGMGLIHTGPRVSPFTGKGAIDPWVST